MPRRTSAYRASSAATSRKNWAESCGGIGWARPPACRNSSFSNRNIIAAGSRRGSHEKRDNGSLAGGNVDSIFVGYGCSPVRDQCTALAAWAMAAEDEPHPPDVIGWNELRDRRCGHERSSKRAGLLSQSAPYANAVCGFVAARIVRACSLCHAVHYGIRVSARCARRPGRQRFLTEKVLIAMFLSARSAYIRVSFAFSASSSLHRLRHGSSFRK